ncbi:MAG: peptidylprolyl isomerase [Gammaproteobacteria bacterium]|nr:peptidylprolyl isomerase [Gammaproteobacteria bacterium]
MKKLIILLIGILIFGGAIATELPKPASSQEQSLDKVAVVVNNDVITNREIAKSMIDAKKTLKDQHIPIPSQNALRKQVINNLIYQHLQEQLLKRSDITVTDDDVTNAIDNIARNNHLAVSALKVKLAEQGINFTKYRKTIKKQVELARLQQQAIGDKVTISDQELNDFITTYNRQHGANLDYRLQDILISLPDTPTPKQVNIAETRAKDIINKLKAGESFAKLAAANSAGQEALSGGDLGYRPLAELPTIFVKYVKSMHKNEVAGPIRAPNGFHILKLVGTKVRTQKLDKEQIRQFLYQQKYQDQLQNWLHKIRAEAYVKVM